MLVHALRRAAVAGDTVPVVARFHAFTEEAVTATGNLAGGQALIEIARVPIVARFARIFHAVAAGADLRLAVARASVVVDDVTVVAGLDTDLHEAIAARGHLARREASVGVAHVPVVAGLHPELDDAVTANGLRAGVGASVPVDQVPVVAPLDPGLHHAVTALGEYTGVEATVGVHLVPSLVEILRTMRPDLSAEEHETLALFISFSMEGSTIFAGFGKPFSSRMNCIKRISSQSFINIVKLYGRDADCP